MIKPYYEHAGITIYHGDCRDILPELPKVDLVLKNSLTNSTKNANIVYGKKSRTIQGGKGKGSLGATESGNQISLLQSEMVNGSNGELLRCIPNGNEQGFETSKNSIKGEGEKRTGKRAVLRWETKHFLSTDNREGQMFNLWENRKVSNPPQERESSRQPLGEPSNSLRDTPQQLSQEVMVEKAKIICITDPPYGIKRDKGFEGFEGFGGFGRPRCCG